jgi:hypothetical protein
MPNTITAIAISLFALTLMGTSPTFAQTKPSIKTNPWDGTWSGSSSAGGPTTVKIANGKVTFWTNNGYPRPKVTGSANGSSVSLDDNNGWKATMTLQSEGKARLSAAGIGNNGKPAKNTAVLQKQ